MKSYDKIPENNGILLDIPFFEGSGEEAHDIAKPHHKTTLVNSPTWGTSPGGVSVLELDGVNQYAEIDAADSVDLDFTAGDYSFGGWYYQESGASVSQILAGKYEVNVKGWEIYTTEAAPLYYLSLRHHHSGGATTRSSAFSLGWEFLNWWFFGISRSGSGCQMYRNGQAVETISELEDPESSLTSDLVISTRFSKDTNWVKGEIYRFRMWDRALTARNWNTIFEKERDFFGV